MTFYINVYDSFKELRSNYVVNTHSCPNERTTMALKPICFSFSLILVASLSVSAAAQDTSRRLVIEDIPSTQNIHRVAAAKTRSGYPVPRYVSLKFGKVNGRSGPSKAHEIKWQYQRRGMPLIVVAETDMWRRVRDIQGDESWVRKPALSGTRTVLSIEEIRIHAKPRSASKIIAVADPNIVMNLGECEETGWCKVRTQAGFKGWAAQQKLWGATALY